MLRQSALLIFLISGLFVGGAHACSCMSTGARCGASAHSSMILGEVLRVREDGNVHTMPDGRTLYGGGRRVFTIKVVQDFRGRTHPGDEIDVETGMGGGDCGYSFRLGERYLIDAYEHDAKLSTGICGLTAPEAAASLLLRELRSAASGGRAPDLSGNVIHYNVRNVPDSPMPTAVPGVPITATRDDGATFQALTGSDGVYELPTVPAGHYTLTYLLPAGLTTDGSGKKPFEITVPSNDGTGAACHLSLNVYTAGRLEGRVTDPAGNGVAGFAAAFDHAPTGGLLGNWSAAGFFGEDGNFSIGPLEAGTYWLLFEPKGHENQHWFYPGSRLPADATPLEVEAGKPKSGLVLVIAP